MMSEVPKYRGTHGHPGTLSFAWNETKYIDTYIKTNCLVNKE